MQNVQGTVYLLHFDSKFGHAEHYVGWTSNLVNRINSHRNGTGSKLVAAVRQAGINFIVARTWDSVDRHFERKLHNRHGASGICPVCKMRKELVKIGCTSDNDYWYQFDGKVS